MATSPKSRVGDTEVLGLGLCGLFGYEINSPSNSTSTLCRTSATLPTRAFVVSPRRAEERRIAACLPGHKVRQWGRRPLFVRTCVRSLLLILIKKKKNAMSRSRHYCSVDGCTNQRRNESLTFFKLPANDDRREKWLQLIGRRDLLDRADLNHNSHYVCSVHFEGSMITTVKKLNHDALPTKFLPDQPDGFEPPAESNVADKSTQTGSPVRPETPVEVEPSALETDTGIATLKKIKLRPTLIESRKRKRKIERAPAVVNEN
ncbi:52 kDa repressor of the inhibitor of the protein kinase [Eumeta japonica]|uniref:52 kDa repressor of the inhibitor of the protein kinase n=1 Tax=Eumeta variegata TaxID=151549 RepID=A0A4C1VFK4_EUMVA|nr:52 kDa repressor of the inhibitor of the protein kinase [Eumeta japonica]